MGFLRLYFYVAKCNYMIIYLGTIIFSRQVAQQFYIIR